MQHTQKSFTVHREHPWEETYEEVPPPMKSVLIVDDEFDNRRALEILLELNGFEAVAAPGAMEALAILRQRRVDIILTDWMMPVLSGGELIERIRAEKIAEGTPIVVLTAAIETVRRLAPTGVRVLGKPFDLHALLATFDELLPPQ